MGLNACVVACEWILKNTTPFSATGAAAAATADSKEDGGAEQKTQSAGAGTTAAAAAHALRHCVVDPFCGRGSALAVANALGMDAMGVEMSNQRCQYARRLQLSLADLSWCWGRFGRDGARWRFLWRRCCR
jgi:hypothetical protein